MTNQLRLKNINLITEFHKTVEGSFDKCYELGFSLMEACGQGSHQISDLRKTITKEFVQETAKVDGKTFSLDKYLAYIDDQLDLETDLWKKAIEITLKK